jgi:hypothetical protein
VDRSQRYRSTLIGKRHHVGRTAWARLRAAAEEERRRHHHIRKYRRQQPAQHDDRHRALDPVARLAARERQRQVHHRQEGPPRGAELHEEEQEDGRQREQADRARRLAETNYQRVALLAFEHRGDRLAREGHVDHLRRVRGRPTVPRHRRTVPGDANLRHVGLLLDDNVHRAGHARGHRADPFRLPP